MDTPTHLEAEEIARKTTRGIGWNYLSFGFAKALSFLSLSILAHMLTPDNFGVVAFAAVVINYLSVLRDLGLGAALVQRRDSIEAASNTVFTLNLLIGAVLTLITILGAPLTALYFEDPAIVAVTRMLGISFLINSLGSVHMVRLQRELDFRRRMIPEMANALIKGATSIGLAFAGYGVWSLVYGQLAGAVTSVVLVWIVFPWRPRLTINRDIVGNLLRFGFSTMSVEAMTVVGENFGYLMIGILAGDAALGIYTVAFRLPEIILQVLWAMTAVMFPAFSSIQKDSHALRKSFLSIVRYIGIMITPICLGLIVAADPIIRIAFGEQWLSAIPVMRVLALDALVISIGFHVGDIYKAVGRPDILVKLSIPVLVVRLTIIWFLAPLGLLYVALGTLLGGLIEVIARLVVTHIFLKISYRDILSQLVSLKGGLILLLATLPAMAVTSTLAPLLRLIIVIMAGVVSYAGWLWFCEHETILQVADIVGIDKKYLKKLRIS